MAKLSSAELAKREDVIQKMKKNKRSLVKRYGSDAEKVMYGRATNIAKKVAESEMEKSNLKELVRAALMQEKKFPDLTGDGKVTKADILKGRGVIDELEQAVVLTDKDHDLLMKNGSVAVNVGGQTIVVALKDFDVDLEDADYESPELDEDLDLGHQDNEPHMLKGDLYRIGKYAMELYQMVDEFEGQGEVDFPHWWQAKIINAREAIESAKHYLDFETKEPEIDAMVGAIDMSGALDNIGVEDEIEEGLPKGFWKKETAELDESFEKLVGKLEKQGKSKKAATAIAGAVAAYKAKGGGKGPTAKQKAK
jgi:hypothetical protein